MVIDAASDVCVKAGTLLCYASVSSSTCADDIRACCGTPAIKPGAGPTPILLVPVFCMLHASRITLGVKSPLGAVG